MSQTFLHTEWLNKLSDPFAVLGVAVTADERRILNRYHVLAKLLHPDRYTHSNNLDKTLATAIFTRLINPAHEQLKHKSERNHLVATLRSEAIAQKKQAMFVEGSVARKLVSMSAREAELYYEEAIASYAEAQYKSFSRSYHITQQIITLNLVYLCIQKPESMILQVNTPAKLKTPPQSVEIESTPHQKTSVQPALINYAQRHYQRAIQYAKQGNWALAVPELRDAIKLEPNNSDYYALLGFVHLRQNFLGMAKVYTRHALKLNPKQPLALKYSAEMKINLNENTHPKSIAKAVGIAAMLSKFVSAIELNASQVLKSR
ncbi:J domain-containing protein [Nostoc sp. TCL26-01]|uniref:J domain-containing protein n=1 Tax=Nostoc sp. TCL26-01 TaxID=2576904 RepID=UPI0015BCF2C1|nr:J domain-containing protein [Nostoc sp. TCL26-01]QLE58864.1 molecular chaperone DnaJ [Nostoc sp. TCL26-01]